jgi:membrane-bound serine protease (ClpP class)
LIALVISMAAFGVDLQTGVPRFWTIIGSVLLVLGSLRLFVSHSMSWLTLTGGIVLTLAFVLSGMPALIRTRYGTSTLGRDWMIGEMAVAATELAPEGTVLFQNAQWRAKVNRLTPIKEGEAARIVGLEGLVLEVEPEEGGAVDYREMRQRQPDASSSEESDASEPLPEQGS